MNWEKLKFWKAVPKEDLDKVDPHVIISKLERISLLKDELIIEKIMELENFRRSVYATLGGIALAHGGCYVVNHEFINAVTDESFASKLSITNEDDGVKISVAQETPEPEGE